VGTYVIIFALITPVIYDMLGYLFTLSPNGFDGKIVIGQPIYNTIITVFGGAMLLAQFFCTFFPRMSINRKFQLLIGGVTAGIIFSVTGYFYRTGSLASTLGSSNPIISILSPFWTTSEKANLVLPLILLGIIGLIVEFIMVALKEEKNFVRKTSQVMLHLSFLIIILGALMSTNMTITSTVDAFENQEVAIPGTSLTIQILDLDKEFPTSGQHSVEYNTQFMINVNSTSNKRTIGFGISQLYWDNANERFGIQNRRGQDVTIISNFLSDIYIVTTAAFEDPVSHRFSLVRLQIKIIPYVNVLWAGCILLHFAILPLTIGRFIIVKSNFSVKEELEDTPTENEKVEKSKATEV
ncbi:MAG: hypothetical protein ACXABG_14020, partial [Promethearchaeota archaeon]